MTPIPIVRLVLVGGVLLVACSEQARRGPLSPSAGVFPEQSTTWACGRVAQATGNANGASGWVFQVPAVACGPVPWLAEAAGDGVITLAPGNLRSTVTGTTVRLDWDAVPGGVTSFLVEAGSATTLADLAQFNTGNAALALVVQSVPGGVYYVRVRGVGPDGIPGPASNEITVRVGACASAPGSPTGFAARVSGNQVTLSWAAGAGDPPAYYILEAGSAAGLSNILVYDTGTAAPGLGATAPNGTYYVRVRGRNACGTGPASNEAIVGVPGVSVGPPGECTYAVSPGSVALSAIAGEFQVRVETGPGCSWAASSQSPFIALSSGSAASGSGAARFSVTANIGNATRNGAVRIAWNGSGQTIAVSQVAPPPPPPTPTPRVEDVIRVVPNPPGIPPVVETVIPVPTPPPPPRPSPSPSPTVTVSGGTAPRTVDVRVAAPEPFNTVIAATDTGTASDGVVAMELSSSHYVIALTSLVTSVDLVFEVQSTTPFSAQLAVTVGSALPSNYARASFAVTSCSYAVTPASINTLAAGGASFDVTVTTNPGCAWSLATTDAFISPSASSGSGTGTTRFTVSSNPGSSRSGVLRVSWAGGGQDISVPQAGLATACASFSLTGPTSTLPSGAGTFDVTITAPSGCTWTASSLASFIGVQTASGTPPGPARFSIAANTGTASRSGSIQIQIAGSSQTLSVSQAGSCAYSVALTTPTPIPPSGGPVGVTVTTTPPTGCPWSASTTASFISPGSTSGTGTASPTFKVAPNTGLARTGVLSFSWSGGGQNVSVPQLAGAPPGPFIPTGCSDNRMSIGQQLGGTLSDSDCQAYTLPAGFKADVYAFEGQAGQVVIISMNRGTLIDPYLYLLDPSGAVIEADDDAGGNLNALIVTRPLPIRAFYTIVASSFEAPDRGTYVLTVSPGSVPDPATRRAPASQPAKKQAPSSPVSSRR